MAIVRFIANALRPKSWARLGLVAMGLSLAAFLASWCLGNGRGPKRSHTEPLRIARPVYNFGNVTPTQTPAAVFTARNCSSRNITIVHLVPSCSCVSVRCRARSVRPGKLARLRVVFNATLYADYQGPFSKYVSVFYRVGGRGRLRLQRVAVEGNIVDAAPFFAYPSTVYIGRVRGGTVTRATVYFTGWSNVLKVFRAAVVFSPGMKRVVTVRANSVPSANYSDRAVALELIVPKILRPGRFTSRILFTLDGFSPVVVTVKGRVVPVTAVQSSGKSEAVSPK